MQSLICLFILTYISNKPLIVNIIAIVFLFDFQIKHIFEEWTMCQTEYIPFFVILVKL